MSPDHSLRTVIVLGVFLVLGLIAVGRLRSPATALPYRRKPLLSAWERNALPALLRQLPPGCHLCPQVRLADLLAVTACDPSARQAALNRIASKSVDFVIVDIASGDVLLVIELDDRSHLRAERQDRDVFVNDALRAAAIPIARFHPGQPLDLGAHLSGWITARRNDMHRLQIPSVA